MLDLAFGEPSNRFHPVAWLGNIITAEMKIAPKEGKWRQITFGGVTVCLTVVLIVALCYLILHQLEELSRAISVLMGAIILKFSFSLRGLTNAINKVKTLLAKADLSGARDSLKALVSRDTTSLDEKLIISATVESAAENTCDSFTAPLFYFLLFGTPGAVAYRIINTFDAMIGYHDKWEYLGKVAARLDDIANYIPARLTGFTIILASLLCRKKASQSWRIMLSDHSKTESPNSGWTMSALAGALEVQLEKSNCYKLGVNRNALTTGTIDASQKIIITVAAIWVLLSITVKGIYLATT